MVSISTNQKTPLLKIFIYTWILSNKKLFPTSKKSTIVFLSSPKHFNAGKNKFCFIKNKRIITYYYYKPNYFFLFKNKSLFPLLNLNFKLNSSNVLRIKWSANFLIRF